MAEAAQPAKLNRLALGDGRGMSWAEYGGERDPAVLYVHGTPSCHLEPWAFVLDRAAADAGVRLIAPDRPGMGGSDFQSGRRVIDWPADVAALVEHLALERFAVLGYSGGVPFAAAVGAMLPERVRSLTLVACVAHLAPGLEEGLHPNGLRLKRLARERPRMARLLMTLGMGLPARVPPLVLKLMRAGLPEVDQAVLDDERVRVGFPAAIRDAFRQGARGPQLDEALMSNAWGSIPRRFAFRPVCGRERSTNSVLRGRWLSICMRRFPGANFTSARTDICRCS